MTINRSALKTYAPKARKDFIAAMVARAAKFGITKKKTLEAREQGDLIIIGSEAFPRKIAEPRRKLISRIKLHGFDQAMEEVAYTWFNRLVAIRYMELHGYLDHGYRVLSHPSDKPIPEILEHAEHLDFPGLNKSKVVDLKLDGTKDAELYRMLLIAQCNALHRAMPFLFERIDDETELLLPDNLLHSDSLIRKLVTSIDEADWQEIEIIGWLYQFYISEKKDEVMGKVVKSEDIPAATQLFTPNWIVKYMVQNALGAQWIATYPESPLKAEMDYYIEPAAQTAEVQRQLDDVTPSELNPEELTLMDPACGSGHILVEAYDLFKAIYLERGYRLRDIPRLILEKNLYGLDIDDRAAQMAGFALLMKARADDRRLLSSENPPALNVMAIQDSKGLDAEEIARALLPRGRFELVPSGDLMPETLAQPTLSSGRSEKISAACVKKIIDLFSEAKNFGSLIRVPEDILHELKELQCEVGKVDSRDIFGIEALRQMIPLARQAEVLGRVYDHVIANPPYMGHKHFNASLKKFSANNYPNSKRDLYSAFMDRSMDFLKEGGFHAQINIPNWMFLSTFSKFRDGLLSNACICSLLHNGRGVFGSDFGSVSFVFRKIQVSEFVGKFFKLFEVRSRVSNEVEIVARFREASPFLVSASQFHKIPGSPIAYWVPDSVRYLFDALPALGEIAPTRKGMVTANNDKYVRNWPEVDYSNFMPNAISRSVAAASGLKWFPYIMGGDFRKWYGNRFEVVNWLNDGEEIRTTKHPTENRVWATNFNDDFIFEKNINWSGVTMYKTAFRISHGGELFASTGLGAFPADASQILAILGYLNSSSAEYFLNILSPTLSANPGDIARLPVWQQILPSDLSKISEAVSKLVAFTESDWNSQEVSWDFCGNALLAVQGSRSVGAAFREVFEIGNGIRQEIQELEAGLNRQFGRIFDISDLVEFGVPSREVCLQSNPNYRYASEEDSDEIVARYRSDTMSELISFSVGCMMGRYSLAAPGLIYAKSDNEGFDVSRYGDFPADDDGIVPITEAEWFDDDAAVRFEEFLKVAWSPETLSENLRFVAESLSGNGGNDPQKTIRNYFSKSFFKDHQKTYKKRPIYWLFSSGKLKAFECLVYLHRYNESTLSRMRMEYVTPLQSRMAARIDQLADDIAAASSSAARNKAQKERDLMVKQLEELRAFDEELRHFADQRITLDLDEGVKVNYAKFGNLLADRKAITGEK
ncbi:BREX-1 system adenine-specific DNA-methyltransferase PglX [Frigidibacter sp. MR17.14]|uniref:BREX-1 system adenine-specific DNA-methyltransferase PglX n=1 Tax=Frigidibacter sp. MR17.14 TaxID=3126509 RepID=UPI003012F480